MAYSKGGVVSTVLAITVLVGFFLLNKLGPQPVSPPQVDTVVVREIVESRAVAETTKVTLTKWKDRVDTLPGDTIWMTRTQFDTIYRECMGCADKLLSLSRFADSVIKARDDSIYKLNRALASCKSSRPWYAIGGLALCAGAGALGR